MRVAIAGASGYTGLELIRLVGRHPQLELVAITSEQRAGKAAGEAFPGLRGGVDLAFESLDAASLAERVDVAFLCLPHGMSATVVGPLLAAGVRVIDLGGDFRLRNMDDYIRWYGEHKAPELFGTAVYGLPEFYRAELAGAPLAAAAGWPPPSYDTTPAQHQAMLLGLDLAALVGGAETCEGAPLGAPGVAHHGRAARRVPPPHIGSARRTSRSHT